METSKKRSCGTLANNTKLKKQNFDGHDIKFVLTKSGIEFLKEYKKFKDL